MPPRRSNRATAAASSSTAGPAVSQSKARASVKNSGRAGTAKKRVKPEGSDGAKQKAPSRKGRKRVKTVAVVASEAAAPNQRGILKQLTETPLDVLLEVFSYLEPLDLLRMSRTTKALRALLMAKSSSGVWQSARLRMGGVPPIFEDLSEPEYANLLFDSHCHNCLKGATKYVQWQIRMRLCRECLESGTIMASKSVIQKDYADCSVPPEIFNITPSFYHYGSIRLHFYDRDSYDSLVEESEGLEYGTAEFTSWFEEKSKEHDALVRECKTYMKWMESRTAARAVELADLRRKRLSSVITHLEADGWQDELKHRSAVEALKEHPHVNQPKELTERAWEVIKPALVELMGHFREEFLQIRIDTVARERVDLLQQLGDALLAKLPESPPNPPAGTICSYQPFFSIIKDGPPLTDVTAEFEKGLERLPDICLLWREKQEAHLKELLRKAGHSEDLSLAVNAFTCTRCSELSGSRFNSRPVPILHHPYFASHHCFYADYEIGNADVTLWTNKRIKVAGKPLRSICQKVIKLCGLDPETATVQDMDATDAFLTCEKCLQYRGDVPENRRKLHTVMRWRATMNHRHNTAFSRVTDADLISSARETERSSLQLALADADPSSFVCVHCDVAQASPSARSEHLSSEHGITSDAVDHYRRSLKDSDLIKEVLQVAGDIVSGDS